MLKPLVIAVAVILVSDAEPVHRCRGLWTGNACIGSESNVIENEPYEGDTYVKDGHIKQRPEMVR